ncbi:MAG: DNA polymerase III subunit beta [Actinomycetales bacterium mxb001]|nr:MAG: DNA polymerase III subunit beta [Actinomycetales bacterium mxb001]
MSQEGSFCIPAKALVDSVNKIPNCNLEVKLDDTTLTLKHKTGKFKINGISSSEYPDFPQLDEGSKQINLSAEKLLEGLKAVLFSASSDETKQVLTGVNFKSLADNGISLATTDGHRLSIYSYETEDAIEECTIPAKVLQELTKIVKPYSNFRLTTSDTIAIINSDNVVVAFRTLVGYYPSYWSLIPKQFSRDCCISRKELIETIERVNPMSDAKENIVKLSFIPDEQKLELTTENREVGSAVDTINCEFSGDPITVCLKARYALEALKSLNGEHVQIKINEALTPLIFSQLGSGVSNLRLLMPIQLRN